MKTCGGFTLLLVAIIIGLGVLGGLYYLYTAHRSMPGEAASTLVSPNDSAPVTGAPAKPSASIDANTLVSTSPTPTLTGTVTGVNALSFFIVKGDSLPKQFEGKDSIKDVVGGGGGTFNVPGNGISLDAGGHWSLKLHAATGGGLPVGTYAVGAYADSYLLTTGVLTITAPIDTPAAAVSGMSRYTDTEFGFSFWFPSNWSVRAEATGDAFRGEPVTMRWIISNTAHEDVLEIKGFAFANYTFASGGDGCTDSYTYIDGWEETRAGCGLLNPTVFYDPTANTIGGLPDLQFQADSLHTDYVVPLSSGKPLRGVVVDTHVGSDTFRNDAALARTISATDPSAATPLNPSLQAAYIRSEQSDYSGE